jgi:hypothetical protein
MNHPWPGNALAYAIFTDMSVTEEGSCGTKQAVIVEGLYNRNPGFVGGIVDGW